MLFRSVGLLEAAENYDYTRQVAFSLFASYRIRGSMVDFLRKRSGPGLLYLDSEISQGFTLSDALPSLAATPTEVTEQNLLREKVEQAMHRLPQKEQQVLRIKQENVLSIYFYTSRKPPFLKTD